MLAEDRHVPPAMPVTHLLALWFGRVLIGASVLSSALFFYVWADLSGPSEPLHGFCGASGVGYANVGGTILTFLFAVTAVTSLAGWALIRFVRGRRIRCSTVDV